MIAGKTLKEISELRSQFCVTFSQEFGSEQVAASNMWKNLSKQKSSANLSDEDAKERKFLDKVFFTVQKYMCKNSENQAPQQMPFRMYRIDNFRAAEIFNSNQLFKQLEESRGVSMRDEENFVNRQVQFVNHITNYYLRKEEMATSKGMT